PDILAMNGASAALCLSGIPFDGPVGAVRVGLVDGKLTANPTAAKKKTSSLELVIAATEDAVLMVEAGASEISEEAMLEAIAFGHGECKKLARAQRDLVQRAGKPRWLVDTAARDAELKARVESLAAGKLATALATHEKQGRAEAVGRVFAEVVQSLGVDESIEGDFYRHFLLHYNFPSFSVGEVRRFGSPSRRDIGHGALAERAVEAVLPPKEEFPYTIRIVSDILESNGSSSMASVCGASL